MTNPLLIENSEQLDNFLTQPAPAVIDAVKKMPGDLMILGAGGKMGIGLAIMAKRAAGEAGIGKEFYAVSRFSNREARGQLENAGVRTIACDLLNEEELKQLPEIENLIYMIGMKFGATGQEDKTWAINVYLPGMAAQRFRHSRIVLFSTGNVYPFVAMESKGCKETDPVAPVGEYAQSALGRERIFQYFSRLHNIPGLIYRLNYANDLRYGVLLNVAQKVYQRRPVDLATGYVNVIWQGDAGAIALRAFEKLATPPFILNGTGKEKIPVRGLAQQFGEIFHTKPLFSGSESDTALLSDASLCCKLFGDATVSPTKMIRWTAHWVTIGGATLNKPTHFEMREGKF